jgi:hypothetical protein
MGGLICLTRCFIVFVLSSHLWCTESPPVILWNVVFRHFTVHLHNSHQRSRQFRSAFGALDTAPAALTQYSSSWTSTKWRWEWWTNRQMLKKSYAKISFTVGCVEPFNLLYIFSLSSKSFVFMFDCPVRQTFVLTLSCWNGVRPAYFSFCQTNKI